MEEPAVREPRECVVEGELLDLFDLPAEASSHAT